MHKDNYKCVFCGRISSEVKLEVDHILPFSKGGKNDISNLQTLCFDCNRGKGARCLK
ncbi:MAG: HNH endonuclease [Symploca sp. SIO3C6]|nr:HNH endonuclease [Symploca sp. SIO3C6]